MKSSSLLFSSRFRLAAVILIVIFLKNSSVWLSMSSITRSLAGLSVMLPPCVPLFQSISMSSTSLLCAQALGSIHSHPMRSIKFSGRAGQIPPAAAICRASYSQVACVFVSAGLPSSTSQTQTSALHDLPPYLWVHCCASSANISRASVSSGLSLPPHGLKQDLSYSRSIPFVFYHLHGFKQCSGCSHILERWTNRPRTQIRSLHDFHPCYRSNPPCLLPSSPPCGLLVAHSLPVVGGSLC
jgi:hypothetical protein